MKIVSEDSTVITRRIDNKFIQINIEVGQKYIYEPEKPTKKRERENKGRIVEVLGFNDNFSPSGAIVKYLDNNRRGLVCPADLLPYSTSECVKNEVDKLKEVLNLELELVKQGKDEGEFICPFCGGIALFKLISLRKGTEKRIVSRCKNNCFS